MPGVTTRPPTHPTPGAPTVMTAKNLADLTEGVFADTAPSGHPTPREWAIAIALAESSGRVGATSPNPDGGTNYGLWQIDSKSHPQYTTAELLTAGGNMRAAAAISNNGHDWGPWGAYHDGRALTFLPQAKSGIAHSTSHHQTELGTVLGVSGIDVARGAAERLSFLDQLGKVGVLGILKIVGGALMMLLGGWMVAAHLGAPGPMQVAKAAAAAA